MTNPRGGAAKERYAPAVRVVVPTRQRSGSQDIGRSSCATSTMSLWKVASSSRRVRLDVRSSIPRAQRSISSMATTTRDERAPLEPFRREEPPETDRRFGGGREVQSAPALWTARKPGQQGKGKRGKDKDNPPKRGSPQYRFQQRQQRKGDRAGGPG